MSKLAEGNCFNKGRVLENRNLRIELGGYSGEVPPLPIPNREVKLTHADGTAYLGGRVGSRLFKSGLAKDPTFLLLCITESGYFQGGRLAAAYPSGLLL